MYYDKDGKSISLMEWADLFEDMKYRKVMDTYIKNYHVSTVWIGLNHSFGSEDIRIFETMIFGDNEDDELDGWMERYRTEEEARLGHEEVIKLVKANVNEKDT